MGRHRKGLNLSRGCRRELEGFERLVGRAGDTDAANRIRAVILVSDGWAYHEIHGALGISIGTVSYAVLRYLQGGPQALETQPRTGRPRKLSEDELCRFEELIDAGAVAYGFPNNLWDAKRARKVIGECFGVTYHPHHVAKILRKRGFSVQRPAPTLARADYKAQHRWETREKPRILRRAKKRGPTSSSRTRSA